MVDEKSARILRELREEMEYSFAMHGFLHDALPVAREMLEESAIVPRMARGQVMAAPLHMLVQYYEQVRRERLSHFPDDFIANARQFDAELAVAHLTKHMRDKGYDTAFMWYSDPAGIDAMQELLDYQKEENQIAAIKRNLPTEDEQLSLLREMGVEAPEARLKAPSFLDRCDEEGLEGQFFPVLSARNNGRAVIYYVGHDRQSNVHLVKKAGHDVELIGQTEKYLPRKPQSGGDATGGLLTIISFGGPE